MERLKIVNGPMGGAWAEKLAAEKRAEIARKGAAKRWGSRCATCGSVRNLLSYS